MGSSPTEDTVTIFSLRKDAIWGRIGFLCRLSLSREQFITDVWPMSQKVGLYSVVLGYVTMGEEVGINFV